MVMASLALSKSEKARGSWLTGTCCLRSAKLSRKLDLATNFNSESQRPSLACGERVEGASLYYGRRQQLAGGQRARPHAVFIVFSNGPQFTWL